MFSRLILLAAFSFVLTYTPTLYSLDSGVDVGSKTSAKDNVAVQPPFKRFPKNLLPKQKWIEVDLGKNSLVSKAILKSLPSIVLRKDIDVIVLKVKKRDSVTDSLKKRIDTALEKVERPVVFWVLQGKAQLHQKVVVPAVSTHSAGTRTQLTEDLAGARVELRNGNTYVLSDKVEWLTHQPSYKQLALDLLRSFINK